MGLTQDCKLIVKMDRRDCPEMQPCTGDLNDRTAQRGTWLIAARRTSGPDLLRRSRLQILFICWQIQGNRCNLRQFNSSNGGPMAVLVKISATGMDQAVYDQMVPGLHPLLKKQPGFIVHVAYPIAGGFAVDEVWESKALHDAWYNEFVKPNLPDPDAMSTEYIEIHAVLQP